MATRLVLAVILALVLPACAITGGASGSDDCVPSISGSVPIPGDPDRKIEDIVEAMTGWSQEDLEEPVTIEDVIQDPNFGGVYGDRQGGIIVTVLDCSAIDVDELARIAGGSDGIRFVEVVYGWHQINEFRDALANELRDLGVPLDVPIESTVNGRHIEVRTPDLDALPDGFGAGVPEDAYTLVESDDLPREG
ncbi:MAG: hypothetical protein ACR2NG_01415 [Acidimicrobiia bacterium]